MAVLIGHPSGNPFSHHAALAHFEAGQLEALCIPWMPSGATLSALETFASLRPMARRLGRRRFPPLAHARKVQGRVGELRRLFTRAIGRDDEALSYQANDWLMRTMARECRRSAVTAVHAYEDCSLWQFIEARRLGKACIYEMPIGYYVAWEKTEAELARRYADWVPPAGLPSRRHVRPQQKRQEMELADVVLAPSNFVADTIRRFHPHKSVALASYGVDLTAWAPASPRTTRDIMTFLFVGQCSIRKGLPLLLEAWRAAGLKQAHLRLVGSWSVAESKKKELPPQCTWTGPVSSDQLRSIYHEAGVFVFPTNFEGRALVVCEALASGLPVVTTYASGADDVVDGACGRIVPSENLEALVEALRWFGRNRDRLPELSRAAQMNGERCTWDNYRRRVTEAAAPFL
jgi:glycosyltransferase involved in cell wall biosynthesis